MIKAPSKLTCLILAALLLLVQMAGSSPDLHGWLHGGIGPEQGCAEHGNSCGDRDPALPASESCSDACAVVVLAGGLTFSPVCAAVPVCLQLISVSNDWAAARDLSGTFRTFEARAPPVL